MMKDEKSSAAGSPAAVEAGAVKARFASVEEELRKRILGQETTVRQLLIAFVASGHAIIIGVPGLAKTLMIRSLGELMHLDFSRIQFTPDLMPSDITGTSILVRDDATGARAFRFRNGPIFTNLLLADEINRTPPKTQAALLEAMEENRVTVGGVSHEITPPFFVLATQNPIEQEGTYPLPITQLDRFLFQIQIDYPDPDTEFDIVAMTTAVEPATLAPLVPRDEVAAILSMPKRVRVPDAIVARATRLVRATRPRESEGSATARELLSWGAGPRAVQAIIAAAQAAAVLAGRSAVEEVDYEEVLLPALRHRVLLNYHAEAEGARPDDVIARIRTDIGDAAPVKAAEARRGAGKIGRILRAFADPSPGFRTRGS
ncbi:MAG: AAA family ATPase [Planctomycetes bacterium]|nr:AAA family ATPase [Planctomycetota bacterium]